MLRTCSAIAVSLLLAATTRAEDIHMTIDLSSPDTVTKSFGAEHGLLVESDNQNQFQAAARRKADNAYLKSKVIGQVVHWKLYVHSVEDKQVKLWTKDPISQAFLMLPIGPGISKEQAAKLGPSDTLSIKAVVRVAGFKDDGSMSWAFRLGNVELDKSAK